MKWPWQKKTVTVQDIWPDDREPFYEKEGYEACATVYRCVKLLSTLVSTLPFGEYDGDSYVRESELLQHPNEMQGQPQFVKYWAMCLLLGGKSFIWRNRGILGGDVLELLVIPPRQIERTESGVFGVAKSFTWWYNGKPKTLDPSDVLHTWYPSPTDFMQPLPPLRAAQREIDLENDGLRWNNSIMRNAGKSQGQVVIDPKSDIQLTSDQVKEVEDYVKEHSGYRNVGKPLVWRLSGLKLEGFGWSPSDMDWLAGLDKMDVRIANVFDVPPELIGSQKTYENFETAMKAIYLFAVLPLGELFCSEWSRWGMSGDLKLGVRKELIKPLQDDYAAISKAVVDEVGRGVRSINDARKKLGEPLRNEPWADVLMVDNRMTALPLVEEQQ